MKETFEYVDNRSFALDDCFVVASVTMGGRTARLFGEAGDDILDLKEIASGAESTMRRKQFGSSMGDARDIHRLRCWG